MKKTAIGLTIGIVLAAGIAGFLLYGRPEAQPPAEGRGAGGGRPTPVLTAAVRRGDIDVVISALGTVTARNTSTVKARVDGQLIRVAFREGQLVKEGDLLAEIDPRPFQVVLDQARGQLARDEAILTNARLDLARYRELLAKDSIAKQQTDTQEALVAQSEGTVQTDRAQVANARLQLDFTRVVAPLSGRLGLRQIDAGNMVHAGDANGIVVITQTQPIAVVFAIPSDSLAAVLPQLAGGAALSVEAWDREGRHKLATGRLQSVDNQIDVATGTVKLKAEFANADNALFPNQFVNARLKVETRGDATLVPTAAIQRGTQGTFCYVVGQDQTVALRPVTVGPVSGDTVAIDKGLEAGEAVVIDGADKLRQGAKVEVASAEARDAARRGQRADGGGPAGEGSGKRRERGNAAAPGGAGGPAGGERKSGS